MKILRLAAWGMVVAIVLGYATLVPFVDKRLDAIEATGAGRVIVTSILVAVLLDIIVLWLSALRHAWQRAQEHKGPLWPVFVLILTNFVGAFFYYFLFARGDTASDMSV